MLSVRSSRKNNSILQLIYNQVLHDVQGFCFSSIDTIFKTLLSLLFEAIFLNNKIPAGRKRFNYFRRHTFLKIFNELQQSYSLLTALNFQYESRM